MKETHERKKGQGRAKTEQLLSLAQQIADEGPRFFDTKGPGKGDKAANSFMAELRKRAQEAFGEDFSEQKICSKKTSLAIDFFFPDEGTIVEIALSLRNPQSEFERDILKAVMAKEKGSNVRRLVFLSKPGAAKRHTQPSSQAIMSWLERNHQMELSIRELSDRHPREGSTG